MMGHKEEKKKKRLLHRSCSVFGIGLLFDFDCDCKIITVVSGFRCQV